MKEQFFPIAAILIALIIGLFFGNYQKESKPEPKAIFSNQLQVDINVLQGQMKAITARYNDYESRLQIIEERMRIFNND